MARTASLKLLCVLLLAVQCLGLTKLGEFKVPLAGFSNLFVHEGATDPTEKYSLILSTFNPIPFTSDATFFYRYIGKELDDIENIEGQSLSSTLLWPREPSQIPNKVFGFDAISQPDGFLVPGKNDGNINIIDLRDPANPVTYDIVETERNWFYHRALWIDANGDGRMDAFTCRTRVDFIGRSTSEFLWLEHPENPSAGAWKEHIISENVGDVFLIEQTLSAGGQDYDVIFTTGYFNEKLAVYWTTHPDGLWDDNSFINERIIDTGGKFFDFHVDDLNLDGRLDLLVSVNAVVNGSLVVYEIPDDFRTGEFVIHLLADGFNSSSGLQGGGSPGSCITFRPSDSYTGRPYLLVSGDDEGTTYYFTAASEDKDNWEYKQIRFVDTGPGNIVGKPTAVDIDGDGFTEIFVPAYTQGKMYIFTFAN